MAVSIMVVLAVIFLTVLGVIETGVAAVLAMTLLAAIFFLMWLRTSAPQGGGQRRKRRRKPSIDAVAGPLAVTTAAGAVPAPAAAQPRVPLPPRPVRAARRRREYVSYPVFVGGGDYADTYVQVDKDTVLKLRNEMTPDEGMAQLPGRRMASFPDPQKAAEVAEPAAAEVVVAAAEPVAVAVEPVAVAAAPVVAGAVAVVEEKEEDFDFDWE